MAILEARGLVKFYGRRKVVDGVNFDVDVGEVVGLLGPNGAGKTTTIDMILGLSQPTSGRVSVYGLQPRQAIERGLVSAVMQTGGLLKDLTVAETATYTASLFPSSQPVADVLARAGISQIADRKVGKCSGGEQQRLRFAMALMPNPDLLILDEPTTGMDVEGRRDFWAAIRQDAGRGRTVLFATHYLEEADALCDRVLVIDHGKIIAEGVPEELKRRISGDVVTLSVSADPGLAQSILARHPGVREVAVEGRAIRMTVERGEEALPGMLRALDGEGIKMESIQLARPTLDDVFLATTGQTLEGAANAPPAAEPAESP